MILRIRFVLCVCSYALYALYALHVYACVCVVCCVVNYILIGFSLVCSVVFGLKVNMFIMGFGRME